MAPKAGCNHPRLNSLKTLPARIRDRQDERIERDGIGVLENSAK